MVCGLGGGDRLLDRPSCSWRPATRKDAASPRHSSSKPSSRAHDVEQSDVLGFGGAPGFRPVRPRAGSARLRPTISASRSAPPQAGMIASFDLGLKPILTFVGGYPDVLPRRQPPRRPPKAWAVDGGRWTGTTKVDTRSSSRRIRSAISVAPASSRMLCPVPLEGVAHRKTNCLG